MKFILQLFIKTFEDHKLSDEEQKFLIKILGEENIQKSDVGFLRNRLFEFAKSSLTEASPVDVFKWLEKVNKILARFERETAGEDFKSEAYFSPIDDCKYAIRGFIQKTKKNLDICVFTISDDDIAKDLMITHRKGVNIRLITDNDKLHDLGSDIKRLAKTGIEVKIDSTAHHMHHKFALRDTGVLLTGSYNWTKAASLHNHENILITQHADVVASYQKEFERLWGSLYLYEI